MKPEPDWPQWPSASTPDITRVRFGTPRDPPPWLLSATAISFRRRLRAERWRNRTVPRGSIGRVDAYVAAAVLAVRTLQQLGYELLP